MKCYTKREIAHKELLSQPYYQFKTLMTMKKNILFFIFIITYLCACNDLEKFDKSNNSQEVNKTALLLRTFNDSLLSLPNHSTENVSTRGWGSFFKKALAIAGADYGGALAGVLGTKELAVGAGMATGGTGAAVVIAVGGALCAASASILAGEAISCSSNSYPYIEATTLVDAYQEIKETNIDYVKLDFPEKFNYINIIGGMHNSLLIHVGGTNATVQPVTRNTVPTIPLPDGPDPDPVGPTTPTARPIFLQQGTLQEQISCINSTEYQNNETQFLESDEFSKVCGNIINETHASCVDGIFNSNTFFQNISIPATENEKVIFDFYNELYNSYPNDINDVIFIANEYIKKIESLNNTTETEKESLYLTISISVNSAYYWSK